MGKGTIIVDSSVALDPAIKAKTVSFLPILKTAAEEVGKKVVANIVALGVLGGVSNVVSPGYTREGRHQSPVSPRVPRT